MPFSSKLLQMGAAGAGEKLYVEDVFSTYLIAGSNSVVAVNNGIDLSGKGGLVWQKNRIGSGSAGYHYLEDTARGAANALYSNLTNAQAVGGGLLQSNGFSSNGFTTFVDQGSSGNQVSWTFRKAKKFFDVVTYTGDGDSNRTISHNLGSAPGCVIVKRTDSSQDWLGWHIGGGAGYTMSINSTSALTAIGGGFTTTTFAPNGCRNSANTITANTNGATYVAYLFAHDAGGFGDAGSDSIIKCGSYTGNGSTTGPTVTLDWEPQWVMIKDASGTGNWCMFDSMRGLTVLDDKSLYANDSSAEDGILGAGNFVNPTATGFNIVTDNGNFNDSGNTYIYIAIRRGPMKTPTSGTSVFAPVTRTGTGADVTVTGAGFPPDFLFNIDRLGTGPTARYNYDRLRGAGQTDLRTNSTAVEGSAGAIGVSSFNMNGFSIPSTGVSFLNVSSASYINYFFGRAPGFFDVVCYTGTGGGGYPNTPHNLGVRPELVIYKSRSAGSTFMDWCVWTSLINDTSPILYLNKTDAVALGVGPWSSSFFTSTALGQSRGGGLFDSGLNYVAYLFATVAGVSKVGSYTGNGTSQTINCGFTGGARFILIKRTDSTGDWYVYDSARGIVSGNDPQLKLNSTAAEATGYDAIDPDNSGFIVNNDATNFPINVNTATYIYLAIA